MNHVMKHTSGRSMAVRMTAFMLLVALVISTLPVSAFAASDMRTSDMGVEVIKRLEGFAKYPYWDYSQYSVGYGTRCPADKLEYYQKNGISEADAEALLVDFLVEFESSVNKFARKYNLSFTQNEFDALVSFTYNCGAGWTSSTGNLITQAVINGYTGNDFIMALTQWCKAGGAVSKGLITRRFIEANMYLHNVYSIIAAPQYGYVVYSEKALYERFNRNITVHGYSEAETTDRLTVLTKSNAKFLGWYTESVGGRWVDVLDKTTSGLKLYPHWQYSTDNEIAAKYDRKTIQSVNLYKEHNTSSAVVGTLEKNSTVSIVADYMDNNNVKWGKTADGSWIDLSKTITEVNYTTVTPYYGVLVTVTDDSLNVRSDAGTSNPKVATVYRGDKLFITDTKFANTSTWGRYTDGWCSLRYTDYKENNEKPIATGYICDDDYANIRAGAGTSYEVVARLLTNAPVNIYEYNSAKTWARIDIGWVSASLVNSKPVSEPTEPAPSEPTPPPVEETTPPEETKPEEPVPPTEPPVEDTTPPIVAPEPPQEEPPKEEPKPNTPIMTGVITASSLRIRSGAGTKFATVGYLNKDAKVDIFEVKKISSSESWGKITSGWISMKYVKVQSDDSNKNDNSNKDDSSNNGTGTTQAKARKGVVTTGVNVRSGPGTKNAKVCSYGKNQKVSITDFKFVGSTLWGKTNEGWVSLDYVKLDAPNNGALAVIKADSLNIRKNHGTQYSVVGSYKYGDVVNIFSVVTVNGTAWGQTNKGWISLKYVV